MESEIFYGIRVLVYARDQRLIGLGTHIGEEIVSSEVGRPEIKILLDSLMYIYEYECYWYPHPFAPPFTAFEFKIHDEILPFYRRQNEQTLELVEHTHGGVFVIEKLVPMRFNGILNVYAEFQLSQRRYYLNMDHLPFPLYSNRPKPN